MHHAGVTLAVVDSISCFLPIPVSRYPRIVSQENLDLTAGGILPYFQASVAFLIGFQANTMSQASVSPETLIAQCPTVIPLHSLPYSHGAVH